MNKKAYMKAMEEEGAIRRGSTDFYRCGMCDEIFPLWSPMRHYFRFIHINRRDYSYTVAAIKRHLNEEHRFEVALNED